MPLRRLGASVAVSFFSAIAASGCSEPWVTDKSGVRQTEGRRLAEPRGVPPDPRFQPRATGKAVRRAAPVDGMRCGAVPKRTYPAHLEIFVDGYVVAIPPGIGVAPPYSRDGAYVEGGRCRYPIATTEPTGIIEIARGKSYDLGDLFAVWGQPLQRHRLAGHTAPSGGEVRAYLNGRRWKRSLGSLPLNPGGVIVLEVGEYVPPHAKYNFPHPVESSSNVTRAE